MTYNIHNLFDGLLAPEQVKTELHMVELARPLKPHQVDVIQRYIDSGRGYAYIAAVMGAGKSPMGIEIIAMAHARGIGPALVICPPSLRITWERELAKFAPWLKVTRASEGGTADVYIMGDSEVSSGYKPPKGKKAEDDKLFLSPTALSMFGKFGVLIDDELHRMKNISNRTKAVGILAESCTTDIRIGMSGTPMPNGRHMELPGQINVLGAGAWRDIGGRGNFYNEFAPKIDAYARGNENGETLHDRMKGSWMHRITEADVPGLLGNFKFYRTDMATECKGKAVQDYLLAEEDLIAYRRGEGKSDSLNPRSEAIVKLTTMRRLLGVAKAPSIAEFVTELLEDEGGVFVTAEHGEVMDMLTTRLHKYNPVAVRGGMSDLQKQAAMDAFNSGKSRVMVGQTTAAGVGLTLHGDGKNHKVVIGQLPWNSADFCQLEGRLARIGQTHDVYSTVPLGAIDGCRTLDERLWALIEMKNYNASLTLDGQGQTLLWDVNEMVGGILSTYD